MAEINKRLQLTSLINELGLKTGVEIGVDEGVFSEQLLENSSLDVLYSIDAWCTDPDETNAVFKKWAVKGDKHEVKFINACERLTKFGERSRIVRSLSSGAVDMFPDGSLDFIYIDASHRFTGVALDLIRWWPKVRFGGIFAGHDYMKRWRFEVMEAVNGFVLEHKQFLNLTTDDVTSRGRTNYPPTWWFIKTDRTKEDYLKGIQDVREKLLAAKSRLAERGIIVELPNGYFN